MSRLLPVLVFIYCTSKFAYPTTALDLRRPAVLLHQAQGFDSRQSVPSEFVIEDQPVFHLQRRTQYNVSSALEQIDDLQIPSDGRYNFPNTADGVDVYIFDSGIRASHSEFRTLTPTGEIVTNSRVQQVFSSQQGRLDTDGESRDTNSSVRECSEHGTHVASLIGGLTYGAAKGVNLKAVQVLNCDGSTDAAQLINATEWLGENVRRPAIVVMAIGEIGRIHQLDRAIERLVSKGVAVLTAAGNNDRDACATTPAGSAFTITVGASDESRKRMRSPGGPGSNFGHCIDLYAPGHHIPGASAAGDDRGIFLSGTSQAVALAAGAAAMLLHDDPALSPEEVRQALVAAAAAEAVDEQLPEGGTSYTAPLLQISGLTGPARVSLSPAALRMAVGATGLRLAYKMKLTLAEPAAADVEVAVVERVGARMNTPATSTLPAGARRGSFDLVVNETIALSSAAADAFFVDVVLSSSDARLDGRRLPVQVLDTKGMHLAYPKVALQVPFEDFMDTTGAGSQHQRLLGFSPCSAGNSAAVVDSEAAAGADVAYFFKPDNDCSAQVTVCSSEMATEVAVFSGVDDADQPLAAFETCYRWAPECTQQDVLDLPLAANVAYVFIARGSRGQTGRLHFSLRCGNTAGSLPTWATVAPPGSGARAPLPPPLRELLRSHVDASATTMPRLSVDLGPSPCSWHPGTPGPSIVQESSTLLFLSQGHARWCPFCAPAASDTQACQVSQVATAGSLMPSAWVPCRGSCAGDVATRGHFCAVQLEAASGSGGASGAAAVRVAAGAAAHDQGTKHANALVVLLGSDACATMEDNLHRLRTQQCGDHSGPIAQCSAPQWRWMGVGDCSAVCGGGAQRQVAKCVDAAGMWLDDEACADPVPTEPSVAPCNTQPCGGAVWQAQPWGECSVVGVRERGVQCVRGTGGVLANDAECAGLEKPVQQEPCADAYDTSVLGCAEGGCFKGSCSEDGAVCVCDEGWSGARCDSRAKCDGLASESGACCAGLRGADKQCCGENDVLDRFGACCPAGRVDACHVCGGDATVVDLMGRCGADMLDAGGVLCAGALDECGVCGGTGLSCDMHARAAAVFVSPAAGATGTGGAQELLRAATSHAHALISEKLGLEESSSLVRSAVAGGIQRATAHGVDVSVVPLDVQLHFSPLEMAPQTQAAASTFWLRAALDSLVSEASIVLGEEGQALPQNRSSPTEQVLLYRVDQAGRAGVCGNGVCELGELVAIDDDGTVSAGCAEDCPLPVLACPLDTQGRPCSGHGVCVLGTGECSCDAGHIGAACEACAPYHTKLYGHCVAPLASIPVAGGDSQSNPVPMLISVLLAVLFVTCVAVVCATRRQLALTSLDCELCCGGGDDTPTSMHGKRGPGPNDHKSTRNFFSKHWPCRRHGDSPFSPVHLAYGRADTGEWRTGRDSIAGSSSLFVPMPMPYGHGAEATSGGYFGRSKGSRMSIDLENDRHWHGSQQSRQDSPGVSTVPVADAHVAIVSSMAGAVLSSGRSVEEGLRICLPGSASPPERAGGRDAAILTTDSGQWRKQPAKAEPLVKVQSEGPRQEQVSSALPSQSEWGVRFSSGVSSWDLSSGAAGEAESMATAGAVVATPFPDTEHVSGSTGAVEASLVLPQLRPPPRARHSPLQSPVSLLPVPVAGGSLRQRASAPLRSPVAAAAAASPSAGDSVTPGAANESLQSARGQGWQALEVASLADVGARPWSAGPSPVHTPQELTPSAEPARTASNLVWTKGLWSIDGSVSSEGDAHSADGGANTGPPACDLASNETPPRERSRQGTALPSTATGGDGDAQESSTDVLPQSTDVGLDCYRSSTAITSAEQSQSVVARGGARMQRDQHGIEFYGSVSDGGTLPFVPAGSAIITQTSASQNVASGVEAETVGFGALEQQVADLMQHVQLLQRQAACDDGEAGAEVGPQDAAGGPSQLPSGGTSLGSLLEVPSELRADPSGSVNFIYGGGLPGSKF